MREDYLHCILSKDNTINLIMFCNGVQYESSDELAFYERARTWDDVKLVIPFKYFFEIVERIRHGRLKNISIEHLMETIGKLENELCAELEMLDEQFIMHMVEDKYSSYKASYDNLSNSLPFIINNYINSSYKLIK